MFFIFLCFIINSLSKLKKVYKMSAKNHYFVLSIDCVETAKFTVDTIVTGTIETLIGLNDDCGDCELNPQLLLLTVLNIEKLKNLLKQLFNTPETHYMKIVCNDRLAIVDAINAYLQGIIELFNLLMVGGTEHDKNLMFVLTLNFETIKDLIKGMK